MELASELRELSRLDEAEAICRKVLDDEPRHVGALVQRGYIARRRGGRKTAVAYFEAAHEADPLHVGAALELAADLRELSRLDEAEAVCRTMIERRPGDGPILVGLAHVVRRARGREASLALFLAAAEASPDPANALVEAAHDLRELSRLGEAEEVLRRALARHPQHVGALIGLGYIARRRSDHDAALAWFERALLADPGNLWAKLEAVGQCRELGRFDAAIALLDSLFSQAPDDPNAWSHRGQIARRQGDRAVALGAFRRALANHPHHVWAMIEIAVEERAAGRPADAEAMLRRALETEPDHAGALMQLIELKLLADSMDEALALSRRLIADHPGNPGCYAQGSRILMELGRREDALELLDRASRICGAVPEIALARVEVHRRGGDWGDAHEVLLSAVEADPSARHFNLWAQRVSLDIALGDFASAASMLGAPPGASAPEKARAESLRGELAADQWQLSRAARHYGNALALNPEAGWTHAALARIFLIQMDLDLAAAHLREMVRLSAAANVLQGLSPNVSQTHVGQLLDEFALDGDARRRLTDIRELPAAERIEPLRTMIREDPDLTSSSILLLVALRQAGLFRGAAREPEALAASARIPKRICQYWDSRERPEELEAVMQSWRDWRPDYSYTCFDDLSASAFLCRHLPAAVFQAYKRSRDPAQKADLFRLACLYVTGGFYADADDRRLAEIGTIIPADAELVVYQEEYGTIGNNFIGAVPGHRVVARALALATEAVNRGDSDIVWLTTGPGLVTRAFAQSFSESAQRPAEFLSRIVMLERHELRRIVAPHIPLPYKRSPKHWLKGAFTNKTPARASR